MGVTGTIKDLDPKTIECFKDYNIKKLVFVPRIYEQGGVRDLTSNGIQVHSDEQQWFKGIFDSTNKTSQNEQPSIIFFEYEYELNDYKQFLEQNTYFNEKYYQILTQDYEDQYDYIIQNATRRGMITLATKCFGRGVDFKCYDNYVEQQGGLYVVFTFISQQKVEETQIKGRTGRNGQIGVAHFHLLQDKLYSKFNINNMQIQDWKREDILYKKIDEKRNQAYIKTIQKQKQDKKDLEKVHQDSNVLLDALFNQKEDLFLEYLNKLNT